MTMLPFAASPSRSLREFTLTVSVLPSGRVTVVVLVFCFLPVQSGGLRYLTSPTMWMFRLE